MSSPLHRYATGYQQFIYPYVVAVYAPNATSVFNITTGPGEILGFGLFRYAGSAADYQAIGVKIVIDGVTYYDSYLSWLCGIDLDYSGRGMFATNDVQSASIASCSFRLPMSYESTAQITFKNNGGANLSLGIGVYCRRGT